MSNNDGLKTSADKRAKMRKVQDAVSCDLALV
ncbi:MAG: hypothetical protein H6Q92_1319 [Nitrospirae bacterium]|nr:hypothetical protein [Nitrospirota bacterium]